MSSDIAAQSFQNQETDDLSTTLVIRFMALFVLFSAIGTLLQLYASFRRRRLLHRQDSTSSVFDEEEGPEERAEFPQTKGLHKLFLNALPTFIFSQKMASETTECSVCLSEFQENEIGRLLPKCNHRFHIACIDRWFRTHSTCPLCRACVGVESLYFYPHSNEEIAFSMSSASTEGSTTLFFNSSKPVPIPVNVLFCGREDQIFSHITSTSSPVTVEILDMNSAQNLPSPSPEGQLAL